MSRLCTRSARRTAPKRSSAPRRTVRQPPSPCAEGTNARSPDRDRRDSTDSAAEPAYRLNSRSSAPPPLAAGRPRVNARPLVLVDMLSYTGTKGGMETYTRGALPRARSRWTPGSTSSPSPARRAPRLDLSWFPGEVIASRISGENRFVWAVGRAGRVEAGRAPQRRRPRALARRRSRPMWTLDADRGHHPRHALLEPPRVDVDAALHAAGDVDGEARRRQRDARDHRQPGVGRRDRASTSASRATGCTSSRWPPSTRAPTPRPSGAARTSSLASGQRRPHKNWDGLIRALALVDEDVRPAAGHHRRAAARTRCARGRRPGLGDWVDAAWAGSTTPSWPTFRRARARWRCPTLAEGFGLPVLEAMAIGAARDRLGPAGAARGRRRRRAVVRPARHARPSPTRFATVATRAGACCRQLARPGWRRRACSRWRRVAEETLARLPAGSATADVTVRRARTRGRASADADP